MRSLTLLFSLLVGCKTVWRSDSEPMQLPKAANSCKDVCGNRVMAPKILGCVATCDSWSAGTVKFTAGGPKDKSVAAKSSCDLTYELRDASSVTPGTWHQSLSFGFSYGKTPREREGGFFSFSTGLNPLARIVDFTRKESRLTIPREFTAANVVLFFQRKDPSQKNLPTFSASEANSDETKSLVVVLDEKFDPQLPFARIKSARYQETRKGTLVYDMECSD